jgi:opacity protein-like surface antigen
MVALRFLFASLILIGSSQGLRSASIDSIYSEGLYGWYEAGGAMVADAKVRDFPDEVTDNNRVKFDPGFHFGIAIGREVTRYVGLEVESGFNYNALHSISEATANNGNFYRVPIMGNVVLKYPNRSRFLPVIGAGAGAQWLSFDAQNITLGATTLDEDQDAWTFTYQGYAGVAYRFQENMSLGIFYHYIVADGPSWKFDNAGGNFKLDAMRTHSVALTLGWYF